MVATTRILGTTDRPTTRRDEIAAAVFSTWVVAGLFLDGWAHNAERPEDFWTPWHAVLYSGFVAGALWFAAGERQLRRAGDYAPPDRLALAGFGLFAVGGVADMAWHSVFGVEEDIEALLSPTHLALMFGGLLLVTSPVRAALKRGVGGSSLRAFLPAAVGITLAVSVVAFFAQFASALHVPDHKVLAAGVPEETQTRGIVAILLTNALLLGAVLWTLRRWLCPPIGTFTLLFGGTALLMAGLDAFDQAPLVAPVAAAGLVADALVAQGRPPVVVALVTPAVLWAGWFATYDAVWGLGWTVELWTGSIVLATLTGLGLHLITSERADAR